MEKAKSKVTSIFLEESSPAYKRWWFWVVLAVVVITAFIILIVLPNKNWLFVSHSQIISPLVT